MQFLHVGYFLIKMRLRRQPMFARPSVHPSSAFELMAEGSFVSVGIGGIAWLMTMTAAAVIAMGSCDLTKGFIDLFALFMKYLQNFRRLGWAGLDAVVKLSRYPHP